VTAGPIILPWEGVAPRVAADAFVAPGAVVVGDVHVGSGSSIWFSAVVRGDMFHVRIGARTSIQDGTVVHVRSGECPAIVGDDVTVGHQVTLHGCTVGAGALVGMGAVVLDRAVVGAGAMVAAGSVVPPGMEVPSGTLALGAPAKVKRPLTEAEREMMRASAAKYAALCAQYLAAFPR
jgi:carbonic anhydrase/acetyltransferase-like protein (isoleucine patch superfamily)